jgi:hypothetical protein
MVESPPRPRDAFEEAVEPDEEVEALDLSRKHFLFGIDEHTGSSADSARSSLRPWGTNLSTPGQQPPRTTDDVLYSPHADAEAALAGVELPPSPSRAQLKAGRGKHSKAKPDTPPDDLAAAAAGRSSQPRELFAVDEHPNAGDASVDVSPIKQIHTPPCSTAQSLSSMSDEDGTPRQPPFDGGARSTEDTPEHMAMLARRLAEPERPRLSQARPSHRARLIDEQSSEQAKRVEIYETEREVRAAEFNEKRARLAEAEKRLEQADAALADKIAERVGGRLFMLEGSAPKAMGAISETEGDSRQDSNKESASAGSRSSRSGPSGSDSGSSTSRKAGAETEDGK